MGMAGGAEPIDLDNGLTGAKGKSCTVGNRGLKSNCLAASTREIDGTDEWTLLDLVMPRSPELFGVVLWGESDLIAPGKTAKGTNRFRIRTAESYTSDSVLWS